VFISSADEKDLHLVPEAQGKLYIDGRTTFVSIDGEGHRTTVGAPGPETGARRLDIIGDSQVFGWGLSDEETFASRLQSRLGPKWRVVNHGVPGVGPLYYADELKRVPENAEVLIVFTEVNDLWDMYDLARHPTRCGYLVGHAWPQSDWVCSVLDLRLVQIGFALYDELASPRALTPLGFDSISKVAAKIFSERTRALFADEARTRRLYLHFAVVPWDGRVNKSVLVDYFPPATVTDLPEYFEDDYGMAQLFIAQRDGKSLFLRHDPHMSPAGATLFASQITDRLGLPVGQAAVVPEPIN
jgi:hypothetical protein